MPPKVLAFGNQKGGVGKTTITLAIAEALAESGQRLLVLDLDPQANITHTLSSSAPEPQFDMLDVLYANQAGAIDDAIIASSWSGIDLVPSAARLARLDVEAITAPETRLKVACWDSKAVAGYDFVVIDLPPSLGRLALNGLMYADTAHIVTEPEAFSITAVQEFFNTIDTVRASPMLNPDLINGGIIVNKRARLSEHDFQLEQLTEFFGPYLIEPVIRRRAAIADVHSTGVPVRRGTHKSRLEVQAGLDQLARTITAERKHP
ncbi:ParA family protein [Arthrobacter castelli]|uniref:ParA family protein n=1 Tax=Arthrobacter castelli TaxID=271431 RepID=UPI0003FDEC2B|nr:AAA family ATPase [Arthrobacter castelli]